MRWTSSAKIYWDVEQNVPIINPSRKEIEDKSLKYLKVTAPADIRPIFEDELAELKQAITREYGSETLKILLPEGSIILLNKIPYVDKGYEVLANGMIIGHFFYDLKKGLWRFKPLYEGASLMLREEIGNYVIVDLPMIKPPFTIHKNHVVKGNYPNVKGIFVVVKTLNGKWEGLAKIVRKDRLRIVKSWHSKQIDLCEIKRSTMDDVIKANIDRIENLVESSLRELESIYKRLGNPPVIASFSGGKDSLTALHIALNILNVELALFSDTGAEFPETLENIDKVSEKLIEVKCLKPRGDLLSLTRKFGIPARDYRWCSKICKIAPMVKWVKHTYGSTRILCIVGQRRYESLSRFSKPKLSRSKWIPSMYTYAIINDFTALDVWLYIYKYKLPVNKLYFKGYDRIGCFMCPACEIAEFEKTRRLHPELWEKWYHILLEFKRNMNLPSEWLKYGSWRWIKMPGDYKRFLEECNFRRLERFELKFRLQFLKLEKRDTKIIVSGENIKALKAICDCMRLKIEVKDDSKVEVEGGVEKALQAITAYVISNICSECSICEDFNPLKVMRRIISGRCIMYSDMRRQIEYKLKHIKLSKD